MATDDKKKQRTSIAAQEKMQEKMLGTVAEHIQLQALNVEMVATETLKPNSYNPNRQDEHEFELLRHSIRKDGFTMPIVLNKDGTIIDGEHRWQAALAEKLPFVPVVRLDLDETKMRLSTIRHNKARGSHDADLEAMVLKDLEKLMGKEFILDELQMDSAVLDSVLNFTTAADVLAGEEFNNSWTPVKNKDNFETDAEGKPVNSPIFHPRQNVDSAIVMRSATPEANLLAYDKVVNKSVEAGKQSLYTFSAIMNPAEALDVQKILEATTLQGETPAEKLYWLFVEMDTNPAEVKEEA